MRKKAHPGSLIEIDLRDGIFAYGQMVGKTQYAFLIILDQACIEQAIVTTAKGRGAEVVEQITVKTQSGTRTRLDMITKEADGTCKLVECKSSATAGLTKNQTKAFPEIEQTGATVVGKGKGSFPGGMQLQPQKVEVIRPE